MLSKLKRTEGELVVEPSRDYAKKKQFTDIIIFINNKLGLNGSIKRTAFTYIQCGSEGMESIV